MFFVNHIFSRKVYRFEENAERPLNRQNIGFYNRNVALVDQLDKKAKTATKKCRK
jgi:hypothetical protein